MDVDVSIRGPVAGEMAQLAAEKVGALDATVQRPLSHMPKLVSPL